MKPKIETFTDYDAALTNLKSLSSGNISDGFGIIINQRMLDGLERDDEVTIVKAGIMGTSLMESNFYCFEDKFLITVVDENSTDFVVGVGIPERP